MTTEAQVQAAIRLESMRRNQPLWRNNSGACTDDVGRLIRYGLGNDSAKLNAVWKSSDLIGITPVRIGFEHVGRTFGVFTAIEVKKPGWKAPSNDRERAQSRFLENVGQLGGFGGFAASIEDYVKCLSV